MSANIGKVVRSRKSEVRTQKSEERSDRLYGKGLVSFCQLQTSGFGLQTSDFSVCSFDKLSGNELAPGTNSDYVNTI
jgi:hypothetical protein